MIPLLKSWFTFSGGRAEVKADRALAMAGWALFAATALWAIFCVPMCMDEALPYHPLACLAYPFAPLHIFREGCDSRYDLIFYGLHVPGSYDYAGFLSSVLYAPVYFLFHAPAGQYWFGLAFFLVFALMLSRLTARPQLGLPLILSFFPFMFQFVHDTGPVRFSMLAFPLGAVLVRRLAAAKGGRAAIYALGIALLVFLATEDKIFFVYLLPGFGFFAVAFLDEKNGSAFFARLKKAAPALALAAALSLAGLLMIFSATMMGDSYLNHLRDMADADNSHQGSSLQLSLLFLFAWPAYAHRVFNMEAIGLGAFSTTIWLTAGFSLAALILASTKEPRLRPSPRTVMLILSFAAMLLSFFVFGHVWAGHHFIFLWVPLLVLLADLLATLTPPARLGLAAGFLALSALAVLELISWPINVNTARDREAVFHYFQDEKRAANAIVNYSSWGGYYIASLYGPKDQLVTYIQPLNEVDAMRLLELAQRTGRQIYDVCYDPFRGTPYEGRLVVVAGKTYDSICGEAYLEDMFRGKVSFTDVMPGPNIWHAFAATSR